MPMTVQTREKKAPAVKPLRLDGHTASEVRRGFGLDPARLQISESPEVRAMGARAVAKGNTISFAPGEFAPETQEGREMLGHELAHVRSQAAGEAPMTGGVLERPGFEAAADRAGQAFAAGNLSAAGPVTPTTSAAAPAQMWPGKKKKKKKQQALQNAISNPKTSHIGEVGQFGGLSQEEKDDIFKSGFRTTAGNVLGAKGKALRDPFDQDAYEYINSVKEKTSFDSKGILKGMQRVVGSENAAGKFQNYNPELYQMAAGGYGLLSKYVETEGFRDMIEQLYANSGGEHFKDMNKNTGVSFDSYMISSLLSRGFNPFGRSVAKDQEVYSQDEKKSKGVKDVYLAVAQLMTNAPVWLDDYANPEKRDRVPEEAIPLLKAYLPVMQKIQGIGMPKVREGLDLPTNPTTMADLDPTPAPEEPQNAPAPEEPQEVNPETATEEDMHAALQRQYVQALTSGNHATAELFATMLKGNAASRNNALARPARKKTRNPFKMLWRKIKGK